MWLVVAVTTLCLNILMHRVRCECCQNDSPQNVIDAPYVKKIKRRHTDNPTLSYTWHTNENKYICTRLGTQLQYRYKGKLLLWTKCRDLGVRWAVVMWRPSWGYQIMKPTSRCRDNAKRLLLPQTLEWGNDLKTLNKLKVENHRMEIMYKTDK